jgi:hypothetical protein
VPPKSPIFRLAVIAGSRSFAAPARAGQPQAPVTNAYHLLSLEPALVISEEALRDAWREAGKQAHPDAGGSDAGFAEMRDAFARLSSPSRRLLHWLELRGTPGDVRGSIASGLMDLFSEVRAASKRAEKIIRKREAAKSFLLLGICFFTGGPETAVGLDRRAGKRGLDLVLLLWSMSC